jgi:hypothetical protein
LQPLAECRFVGDRIALVDRLGAVTDHRHGGATRHAGALKITDGRAAKVVRDTPRKARQAARGFPLAPIRPDRLARPMEEPGNHPALLALETSGSRNDSFENAAEFLGQREIEIARM